MLNEATQTDRDIVQELPGAGPCIVCRDRQELLIERLYVDTFTARPTSTEDREVHLITGAPRWAAEYFLQGFRVVSRYTCAGCGITRAVLAK